MKLLPKFVNTDMSTIYFLSAKEKYFFKTNGYLIIKKLFDLQQLDKFRQRFRELCSRKVSSGLVSFLKDYSLAKKGANPEEYINKIQELFYDEVFSKYSEDPRMLHIISQLLEDDNITGINCMLINKPPGTGEHPPHQDHFYFPIKPADKILTTWTAIDPVTFDNGCLYVLPGSHNPVVLHEHHNRITTAKFVYGIVNSDVIAPESKRVHLPMEPGDTIIFYPCLVHGSRPNTTKLYRKAMTCHFASSQCKYYDPKGTIIEDFAKKVEEEVGSKGSELGFVDLWRIKTKQIKGVRSNL